MRDPAWLVELRTHFDQACSTMPTECLVWVYDHSKTLHAFPSAEGTTMVMLGVVIKILYQHELHGIDGRHALCVLTAWQQAT